MLTAALIVACLLLAVFLFAVWQLWRQATVHVADQADLLRRQCQEMRRQAEEMEGLRCELDALSIAGPPVDPIHGSHDRLPITDDNRQMLTDYCEGMWQHTQEDKL